MVLRGRYIVSSTAGEEVKAFVPNPLPPDPAIQLDVGDWDLFEQANRALGRLDGVTSLLPDPFLFIYFYVRKEAVLSSQIEGTQSSLSDLLVSESEEAPGIPIEDVREVSNYVAAMEHGLKRLKEDNFPLSLRLIKEIHEVLLQHGRGSEKTPGEFRTSQNWVGGTRPGNAVYIPPPPEFVTECMGDLELFLHDRRGRTPSLMKAALAHVQFESIHPFLDGNGRIGRLLITLLLCVEKVLEEPLLYLSLYFKQNRTQYYDHLQRVRTDGDWIGWIRFFLNGVLETSRQAVQTARRILDLAERDMKRLEGLGRRSGSALRVLHQLQRKPIISVPSTAAVLGLSPPTVYSVIEALMDLNILRELTGKQRDRLYAYDSYLKILAEGTETEPG